MVDELLVLEEHVLAEDAAESEEAPELHDDALAKYIKLPGGIREWSQPPAPARNAGLDFALTRLPERKTLVNEIPVEARRRGPVEGMRVPAARATLEAYALRTRCVESRATNSLSATAVCGCASGCPMDRKNHT